MRYNKLDEDAQVELEVGLYSYLISKMNIGDCTGSLCLLDVTPKYYVVEATINDITFITNINRYDCMDWI